MGTSHVGDVIHAPNLQRRKAIAVVSLLGHLVPEWRPEDAATRALAYMLDPGASPGMAQAFVELLGGMGLPPFPLGPVDHDPTQADDSRPDVTIRDADGQPRVFVEATFWEGVDEAQPTAYLRKLPTDRPSAVVFVAPHKRIAGLWREFTARCRNTVIDLRNESPVGGDAAWGRAGARTLVLTSWTRVLEALRRAAMDQAVEQDIIQLRGLTDQMEREGFLPLEAKEVADVGLARRLIGYRRLVGSINERLVKEGIASQPKRWNSGSYVNGRMANQTVRLHGKFELRLGIELKAWRDLGITPLWWVLTDSPAGAWETIKRRVDDVKPYGGRLYIPIRLKLGVERDAVIRDAVKQMCRVADRLLEVSRHE